MKFLPNGTQMKAADKYTISETGVPSRTLMENAANACMGIMFSRRLDLSYVCIVCGTGNNGGDGLALARFLAEKGIRTEVLVVGDKCRFSAESGEQWTLLCEKKVKVIENDEDFDFQAYSVIVDALFGVGLSRDIEGVYGKIIEQINHCPAFKLAVDIPSGISSDSGQVMGIAVQSDLTVTFQCAKLGMMLYPGNDYCGSIEVADIGIHTDGMDSCAQVPLCFDEKDFCSWFPKRRRDSHKGTYGKLLIIAGSEGMAGAAYLNGLAAYRTGAGLVKIVSAEANIPVIQQLLPEAITGCYDHVRSDDMDLWLEWADTVCIGSGLGMNDRSEFLVSYVCRHSTVPILIDADAISLIAASEDVLPEKYAAPVIFTPHLGEFSRLSGLSVNDIKKNRLAALHEFTEKSGSCCVLKDSRTLIAQPGQHTCVNLSGNPGMAKAGSGDVLAGVISGFLAQGLDSYKAAVTGVYYHGCSGDRCTRKQGMHSILARDIANNIGNVFPKKEDGV